MWSVFKDTRTTCLLPLPFWVHDLGFCTCKRRKMLIDSILLRNIVLGICNPIFHRGLGKPVTHKVFNITIKLSIENLYLSRVFINFVLVVYRVVKYSWESRTSVAIISQWKLKRIQYLGLISFYLLPIMTHLNARWGINFIWIFPHCHQDASN